MDTPEREAMKELSKKIAELLPPDMVADVVSKVISEAISRLAWNADTIQKIVMEAVAEKAKELLKTRYAAELDKQADMLAVQLVSTLVRMRMPER